MTTPLSTDFPLKGVTTTQLHALCKELWGWHDRCAQCSGSNCPDRTCDWSMLPGMEPFFQYYKDVAESYITELDLPEVVPAIGSHEDLLEIISCLQRNPTLKRTEVTALCFSGRSKETLPRANDLDQAVELAARVALMILCSRDGQVSGPWQSDRLACPWRNDETIGEFISSIFTKRHHPTLNSRDLSQPDIRSELKATNLKNTAKLRFVATNYLHRHLQLDQKSGTVKIYHHTKVMEQHLSVLNDIEQCAERGMVAALPRQLLIETMDSIQNILFPVNRDSKSRAQLQSLVSRESFDPDCLEVRAELQVQRPEDVVQYQYWGVRLMDLYEEVKNPKARGAFDSWLERKSLPRHTMLAAILGIFMAVVVGLLALFVAIFSTWIAWQAWKHPVEISEVHD